MKHTVKKPFRHTKWLPTDQVKFTLKVPERLSAHPLGLNFIVQFTRYTHVDHTNDIKLKERGVLILK